MCVGGERYSPPSAAPAGLSLWSRASPLPRPSREPRRPVHSLGGLLQEVESQREAQSEASSFFASFAHSLGGASKLHQGGRESVHAGIPSPPHPAQSQSGSRSSGEPDPPALSWLQLLILGDRRGGNEKGEGRAEAPPPLPGQKALLKRLRPGQAALSTRSRGFGRENIDDTLL